jgi:deoxyadenosine/deoxycytidine kinase
VIKVIGVSFAVLFTASFRFVSFLLFSKMADIVFDKMGNGENGKDGWIPVYVIEGLIGSGKSTLMREMARQDSSKSYRFILVEECLQEFEKFQNYNPLQLIYEKPEENAVAAQMHFVNSMCRSMTNILQNETIDNGTKQTVLITDRSLFSCLVFIDALHELRIINDFTRDFLGQESKQLAMDTINKHRLEYRGVFFLDAPLDLCMDRISSRGRSYELDNGVSKDYLTVLQAQYFNHGRTWENDFQVNTIRKRDCKISESPSDVKSDFIAFMENDLNQFQNE